MDYILILSMSYPNCSVRLLKRHAHAGKGVHQSPTASDLAPSCRENLVLTNIVQRYHFGWVKARLFLKCVEASLDTVVQRWALFGKN
jgi:hypothetical protein